MIRLHTNGYFGVVQNGADSVCTKRLRKAIIVELYAQGLTLAQVGEVFGLRKTRVGEIVGSHNPHVEPLFGSGQWQPSAEDQNPHTCNRCGGDDGVIKQGSKLYCAACHRTGFDRKLQEQKVVAEIAEQFGELEADYQAAAKRKPLAQRRKIKRA